jgi:hypothetical protein
MKDKNLENDLFMFVIKQIHLHCLDGDTILFPLIRLPEKPYSTLDNV